MPILDLTNFIGKRPESWPEKMPKRIMLVQGNHQYEYDIHPKHRNTVWYKELVRKTKKLYPYKSENMPVGVNSYSLGDGTKIIAD